MPCSLAWYMAASASRRRSSARSSEPCGDGDAEARAQVAAAAVEHERAPQLGREAVGDATDVGEAGDALEQDHELVAAEAGDRVAGAQCRRQALGRGHQQLVAGAVAERVVDDLEVVDVTEQDREPAAGLAPALERGGQHAVEPRPVRQPGERVEPLGVALAVGDVDALGDEVVRVTLLVADQRVAPEDPADAAVGADVTALGLGAVGLGRPACAQRLAVPGGDEVPEVQLLGVVVAGVLAQLAVGPQQAATRVDQRDRDRRVVERAPEALARAPGRGADALVGAPRDQVGESERGDEGAVDRGPAPRVVGMGEDRALDGAHRAVLEHDEADRQQVRPPLLIERERGDHQEVVEVRLDRAVPGDDEDGRAAQQRERAQAGAQRARELGRAGGGAERGRDEVEPPRCRERPVLGDGERGQHDEVRRQHEQQPAMTRGPDLGRERAASRQPGEQAEHPPLRDRPLAGDLNAARVASCVASRRRR